MFENLKGFNSSIGANSSIINEEVVKADIMKEIESPKGSFLCRPNYGTSIQEMIFEPMTSSNVQQIQDSIADVFERDGRANIKSIDVTESDNSILIYVSFYYVNNFKVDDLSLSYDTSNLS